MPISDSASILGGVGQWNTKYGEIDLSLTVTDTNEGPSFSFALAKFDAVPEKNGEGAEILSPILSVNLDHAEFLLLAQHFASAAAAMQAVAAKRPANDG